MTSPRQNNTYKRLEDPLKNEAGKMICKYPECADIVFERKCEWNKHMDKHERPYKCKVSGCEKLLGFTYTGGLLRHEREVHKMHGGTKQPLFCPHQDCKRSSGPGFTRKENLAEHIRRVHRQSEDRGDLVVPSQDARDQGSDFRPEETQEDDVKLPMAKRKRSVFSEDLSEHDLKVENKRLRREIAEKNAQLQKLTAELLELRRANS
jgi:hypothetical protein